jgi:hypothetical protein
MNNLIEVIMPMRGNCRYVEETIESLIQDLGTDFSLCIPFSELESSARNLINSLAPMAQIRYVDANGMTLAEGLNEAVSSSSKEYLLRIDSDDKVVKGRAHQQLEFLIKNPEAAVVGSQMFFIDENSTRVGQTDYSVNNISSEFGFGCKLAHPSVMLRRSHVLLSGNYQDICTIDGRSLCEDFDLWLRILELFEICVIDLPLTEYRLHTGQSTQKFSLEISICSLLLRSRKIQKEPRGQIPVEALRLNSKEIRIAWRAMRAINSPESRIWLLELSILLVKNIGEFLNMRTKERYTDWFRDVKYFSISALFLIRHRGTYKKEILKFRQESSG